MQRTILRKNYVIKRFIFKNTDPELHTFNITDNILQPKLTLTRI